MKPITYFAFFSFLAISAVCFGQPPRNNPPQPQPPLNNQPPLMKPLPWLNQPRTSGRQPTLEEMPSHYTFVPRNDSREGDYKVVVVPAVNPRQARIDAQTYHVGWDAIYAMKGQSSVMYDVLLRKRAPYVPGTPPVTRRIPRD